MPRVCSVLIWSALLASCTQGASNNVSNNVSTAVADGEAACINRVGDAYRNRRRFAGLDLRECPVDLYAAIDRHLADAADLARSSDEASAHRLTRQREDERQVRMSIDALARGETIDPDDFPLTIWERERARLDAVESRDRARARDSRLMVGSVVARHVSQGSQ